MRERSIGLYSPYLNIFFGPFLGIRAVNQLQIFRVIIRDHSGQCPDQYGENFGLAIEQSAWLVFVISPLNLLCRASRVVINRCLPCKVLTTVRLSWLPKRPGAQSAPFMKWYNNSSLTNGKGYLTVKITSGFECSPDTINGNKEQRQSSL